MGQGARPGLTAGSSQTAGYRLWLKPVASCRLQVTGFPFVGYCIYCLLFSLCCLLFGHGASEDFDKETRKAGINFCQVFPAFLIDFFLRVSVSLWLNQTGERPTNGKPETRNSKPLTFS
jgi:hypothetical protein